MVDIGQATAVFAAPSTTIPRAVLAIRSPDQPVTRVDVRPGTIRLGRSLDNDVVLADARASRHHGQITARMGMLVYTDLGSTNGSFLNNAPVTEIALGPGDELQLGSSTITIEPGS
jgi:pSer/pThr/pTyr-binding forkhead associated (FHA) protein